MRLYFFKRMFFFPGPSSVFVGTGSFFPAIGSIFGDRFFFLEEKMVAVVLVLYPLSFFGGFLCDSRR